MTLTVCFVSPMLVGGMEPQMGGVDRATVLDDRGVPDLPVSALKGAWRIELERLSRGVRLEELGHLDPACHLLDGDEACIRQGRPLCIACSVFGNEQHEGRLRIETPRRGLWPVPCHCAGGTRSG